MRLLGQIWVPKKTQEHIKIEYAQNSEGRNKLELWKTINFFSSNEKTSSILASVIGLSLNK